MVSKSNVRYYESGILLPDLNTTVSIRVDYLSVAISVIGTFAGYTLAVTDPFDSALSEGDDER